MTRRKISLYPLLIAVACLFAFTASAQVDVEVGKNLFKNNCAQCHNKNMKDDMTGPALCGVEERWEGREELLYTWIRNSQEVIASGDEYAVNLYNEWNKALMNPFPDLTDDEIASILEYIKQVCEGTYGGGADKATAAAKTVEEEEEDNTLLFAGLLVVLLILTLILARIVANLNHIAEVREGMEPGEPKTLRDTLTSKGVIGFVVFALVVLGGYTTVNNAIDFGRQQGYAPQQPIKFSHEIHAGTHQIDCQYCHDGARRSKHAVIPAANTCMNCHRAIKKGSLYGTAELTKIFASIGYDPNNDVYIDNYDDMPEAEVESLYRQWIADSYIKEEGLNAIDREGERLVDEQWAGIVNSLTHELKPSVKGPIEWIRVHNLPDHVYFNHSQHVQVGQIECQECHGPVEEMELLQQYSTLSMGWCINCHRETEVQFKGNEYYQAYEKYHKELADGDRTQVTVEDIGGLECQKCHY